MKFSRAILLTDSQQSWLPGRPGCTADARRSCRLTQEPQAGPCGTCRQGSMVSRRPKLNSKALYLVDGLPFWRLSVAAVSANGLPYSLAHVQSMGEPGRRDWEHSVHEGHVQNRTSLPAHVEGEVCSLDSHGCLPRQVVGRSEWDVAVGRAHVQSSRQEAWIPCIAHRSDKASVAPLPSTASKAGGAMKKWQMHCGCCSWCRLLGGTRQGGS